MPSDLLDDLKAECPLCGDEVGFLRLYRGHLYEYHQHEMKQRQTNPEDRVMLLVADAQRIIDALK